MGEASETLAGAVRRAIERHGLLDGFELPRRIVVVAVSGGPDSLCLLHVLLALCPEYGITLHVAHLNHGLRGAESDADARFVQETAEAWAVPVIVGVADVPALVRERKLSVEEAARQARYAFLAQAAAQLGADRIALGHNADDQTETALMHWLRGAGLAGLRGMAPKSPLGELRFEAAEGGGAGRPYGVAATLIRPLLFVTRAQIEAYCVENSLAPRFDRSNLDTTYFRNRLRHDLLPLLAQYNPNIREVIRRSAQALAGDYEVIRAQAEAAWRETLRNESAGHVTLDLARWRALPIGLQRSTLRMAVERLRRNLRDVGWEHAENAVWIGRTRKTGTQATLPDGLMLTVGYDELTVGGAIDDEPKCPWLDEPVTLGSRGVTLLPGSCWRVEATELDADSATLAQIGVNRDPNTAYLDGDRAGQLALRRRQPGDRFQPLGLGGCSKSVREFMINEKVPVAWRDRIPLCVAVGAVGAGQRDVIAWVVGWRLDERFKVGTETRRILRLTFSTGDGECRSV
jgi:tRNA(Ile)-lysidine synthase